MPNYTRKGANERLEKAWKDYDHLLSVKNELERRVGTLEGLTEDARKEHEEHRAKIDFLTSTPWRG